MGIVFLMKVFKYLNNAIFSVFFPLEVYSTLPYVVTLLKKHRYIVELNSFPVIVHLIKYSGSTEMRSLYVLLMFCHLVHVLALFNFVGALSIRKNDLNGVEGHSHDAGKIRCYVIRSKLLKG